ncbi:MAG: hypothetical protein IPI01_03240 [Ignavibacteriae bacterium]|nr:hypothetical protein [Ignavibacteriota bacterium]
MESAPQVERFRPLRALLNGLVAVLLGWIIFLIPAFTIAISIGFDLGPQGVEQAEISRVISNRISELYRGSLLVQLGGTLIVALLVYWRARVCASGAGAHAVRTGLVVAVVPVIWDLISTAMTGAGIVAFLMPLGYVAAGYFGGAAKRARVTPGA